MPKVAVILSGCGYLDGGEVHESVLTILALDRKGVDIVYAAPSGIQYHVVDHITGNTMEGEKRSVLIESARISRGNIKKVSELNVSDLDAVVFPGGFGAAKNWSDFAFKGKDCTVNPEIEKIIRDAAAAKKPMGFLCIAPAVAAKALQGQLENPPKLTIGNDGGTAAAIEDMGAVHVDAPVDGVVIDDINKIVSTPAYMLADRISQVEAGATKLVERLLAMI